MARSTEAEIERVSADGAAVIKNRLAPNGGDESGGPVYPENAIKDLVSDGLFGLIDYDTGRSANPEDIDSSNTIGRGSLNNYASFTRTGGYILAHDKYGNIYLGHATPGCGQFVEMKINGEPTQLKCATVDAYAQIDENKWAGIAEIVDDGHRGTFVTAQKQNERERIVSAFTALERNGDLIYP